MVVVCAFVGGVLVVVVCVVAVCGSLEVGVLLLWFNAGGGGGDSVVVCVVAVCGRLEVGVLLLCFNSGWRWG